MTTKIKNKEIGGYFGLELPVKKEYWSNSIKLNCARNALRYIIRVYKIKEINIPFYTCPVVWQAARKENCKINFYHINKNFMPSKEFNEDDFILYTNYFGICTKNAKKLAKKYKNLILDNAQSFFTEKIGLASFNSARKFVGVPDGAYLFCNKKIKEDLPQDISFERVSHLIKRLDIDTKFGYQDFCSNEDSLENEPVETMSNFTQKVLKSIDYEQIKKQRIENFNTLHKKLGKTNEIQIDINSTDVPMVYPYMIKNESLRKHLINNGVYVEQYWQPLDSKSIEADFQKYILPLPIDQRYNKDDMERILDIILY